MCEAAVEAYWASTSAETPGPLTANPADPSHQHLEMDEETGEPVQARFTYVDEHSCIGCTFCATTARNTFFMEDDHGRARVYNQGGDSADTVQEAIDTCPVSCIHYVSHEDLVILETERVGQFINNAQRLRSQQEATAFVPPTAASGFNVGGMRCNNCPTRGCKECPMFGVGENPIYLERVAAREERRRESGEAQREEEQRRRDALITESLMAGGGAGAAVQAPADGEEDADGAPASADEISGLLDALFAAPAEEALEEDEEVGTGGMDGV